MTEWLAIQVPDGTDWIEYMLNQPEHADLQLTGVMNHISLGVVDIKKAQATLESHGWKPHGDEKAQMGKDGKWQLNLYDPDLVRVELMEFKPVAEALLQRFHRAAPVGVGLRTVLYVQTRKNVQYCKTYMYVQQ